jgi:CheY-like chemotaxis protein
MARVLIADDNRDAADMLAFLFELEGHQVEVAYSGYAAMKVSTSFKADLALLDINMPGADGYEVARHLHGASPGTVIVAITGSHAENREKALRAGFAGHFLKPAPLRILGRCELISAGTGVYYAGKLNVT